MSNHELQRLARPPATDREDVLNQDMTDMTANSANDLGKLSEDEIRELDGRTKRKLDFILLPFLALLFLFNSLDRSNIGNAESADFTKDVGLDPQDLNTAVAVFFAFFVALQPVGAALGRKFGMAIWVPSCMTLWGVCTALHIWVRTKWQLITLRMVIGILEAGFYPVAVSYLSLFYTRYEFARRLGLFYGQYAVAGALGGLLSYVVFSHFPHTASETATPGNGWKSWQILFLLEGASTIVIAATGFFWLPHNAKSAWFLNHNERLWAEERIRRDKDSLEHPEEPNEHPISLDYEDFRPTVSDETYGLLGSSSSNAPESANTPDTVTDDRGLSSADILRAVLDWKLWFLLVCNILSSVPVTAFSVFLPLVLKSLADDPANANLLTAPPFLIGAFVLYAFTHWSDKSRQRLVPILWGLALLLIGLTGVVVISPSLPWLRYSALCLLLSGTFVASPLTVAWFTGNTPDDTGKRSVVLGINGWGNLAGVFAAQIFRPNFAPTYRISFFVTLGLVLLAFAGYWFFRILIIRENRNRTSLLNKWSEEDVESERRFGRGPLPHPPNTTTAVVRATGGERAVRWISELLKPEGRKGSEKMTFQYGL